MSEDAWLYGRLRYRFGTILTGPAALSPPCLAVTPS